MTRAEDAFKALKSDLGLRPNGHHIEPRVEGHVFITILAYQLLRFIQYTLERHADTRCWQTIKRVLQTHTYATLILPTRHGEVYRLRKAGIPEQSQKQIYNLQWNKLPVKKSMVKRKVETTLYAFERVLIIKDLSTKCGSSTFSVVHCGGDVEFTDGEVEHGD